MCGIVGIYRLDQYPVSKKSIRKFTKSLNHRGPDGSGVYIADEGYLALGHTRLSILDLTSQGKQPLTVGNGRYWLTFNGEIYNFLEIRADLKRSGYVFTTETDTEVILASYIKWGKACLDRFNGMWAFALWDNKQKKLFLARDRFAIKPLYYIYLPNKMFAFASETKSFDCLDGFNLSVNESNLGLGIEDTFRLESEGKTIFESVKSLQAGCYLEVCKDMKPVVNRWWDTFGSIPIPAGDYKQQVDEYRELFFDACRIRLRSDVPVASAVSGGLDSSSVFVTCNSLNERSEIDRRRFGGWGKPFVLSFPGTKWDELSHARRVVNGVDEKLVVVEFDDKSIADDILKSTQSAGFIYLSPPVVPLIYKTMQHMGYKVSMDGHGADEALFGYPDMIAAAILKLGVRSSSQVVELIRVLESMHPGYQRELIQEKNILLFVLQKLKESFLSITPDQLIAFYRDYRYRMRFKTDNSPWLFSRVEPYDYPLGCFSDNDPASISYQEVHSYRLPTLLRNWDHASMEHGIEIRMPFMDWRLMTYSLGLPLASLCGAGYSKRILRDAMATLLPPLVKNRKDKIGVNAPMEYWFSNQMSSLLQDIVSSERFLQSSVWNGRAINAFVKDRVKNKSWTYSECQKVWPFINAYIVSG